MSTTPQPRDNNFWIDTHSHIFAEEFKPDRDEVLHRATTNNVQRIVMPNVDRETIDAMMDTEARFKGQCFATMGLHPCSVKKDFQRELYIVEDWLSKRTFTALGEMGTDLYWDKTFWEQQKEAFTIQANWAKRYRLPLIIHCRESIDETITLVEGLQDGKLTGVFHCFGGSAEQAARIVKLNFYVGIGGVSTFKKSGLDQVLPEIPADRVVLETDSPYLAPVPHRGKRNESAYIPLIGKRVAEIRNVSPERVMEETTQNALRLFPQIV
jgi:TatD DNase family protein